MLCVLAIMIHIISLRSEMEIACMQHSHFVRNEGLLKQNYKLRVRVSGGNFLKRSDELPSVLFAVLLCNTR